MIRFASTALVLAAVLCGAAVPAEARKKHAAPAEETDAAPQGADKKSADKKKDAAQGKPVQVGTYGDWGAYLAKGKNKTCYALARPRERKPDVKHDAAYVFISDRPAEKVHNEVSIIMGFPLKENGAATAKVGSTNFDLVAKGSNAWIKNVADEQKFVEALKHAPKLVVKAPPAKGPMTTDSYSLAGLKQALDRVTQDCK